MPLFECEKCHCVDNTAAGNNFWVDHHRHGGPALCAECDPKIGKWHDIFAKKPVSEFRPGAIKYPIGWREQENSNE